MSDTFSPALETAIDDFDDAALSFGLVAAEWDSVEKDEASKAHAVSKQTLRAAIRAEVEAACREGAERALVDAANHPAPFKHYLIPQNAWIRERLAALFPEEGE